MSIAIETDIDPKPEKPTKQSRMAEIVAELMGAQTAERLFAEIWSSASPEVKREISDKVINLLMSFLNEKDGSRLRWSVESAVQNQVQQLINAEAVQERYYTALRTAIPQLIQEQADKAVPLLVKRFLESITQRINQSLHEKIPESR